MITGLEYGLVPLWAAVVMAAIRLSKMKWTRKWFAENWRHELMNNLLAAAALAIIGIGGISLVKAITHIPFGVAVLIGALIGAIAGGLFWKAYNTKDEPPPTAIGRVPQSSPVSVPPAPLYRQAQELSQEVLRFAAARSANQPTMRMTKETWEADTMLQVNYTRSTQDLYAVNYAARVVAMRDELAAQGFRDNMLDSLVMNPTNVLGLRELGARLGALAEKLRAAFPPDADLQPASESKSPSPGVGNDNTIVGDVVIPQKMGSGNTIAGPGSIAVGSNANVGNVTNVYVVKPPNIQLTEEVKSYSSPRIDALPVLPISVRALSGDSVAKNYAAQVLAFLQQKYHRGGSVVPGTEMGPDFDGIRVFKEIDRVTVLIGHPQVIEKP